MIKAIVLFGGLIVAVGGIAATWGFGPAIIAVGVVMYLVGVDLDG